MMTKMVDRVALAVLLLCGCAGEEFTLALPEAGREAVTWPPAGAALVTEVMSLVNVPDTDMSKSIALMTSVVNPIAFVLKAFRPVSNRRALMG
jgi:hypothetical protein